MNLLFQSQQDSQDMNSDLLDNEKGLDFGLEAWETEEWLAGAERWKKDQNDFFKNFW